MTAADHNPTPTEPRRSSIPLPRPLWIGLLAVALVVIAIGLQIGVPAYQQNKAIQEIEQIGGKLEMRPRGPEWLRSRIGDERMKAFDEAFAVELQGIKVAESDLIWLNRLRGLQRLDLWASGVSDAGMVHLSRLTSLRWLDLDDTKISDAGLKHVQRLSNLEHLSIRATHVTENGVAELKQRLPDLEIVR